MPDKLFLDANDIVAIMGVAKTTAYTCASSLGLTITSRCRLVIPKSDDKPKENKFRGFGTG